MHEWKASTGVRHNWSQMTFIQCFHYVPWRRVCIEASVDSRIKQNSPCTSWRLPSGSLERHDHLPIPQSSQSFASSHTPLKNIKYTIKKPVIQTLLIPLETNSKKQLRQFKIEHCLKAQLICYCVLRQHDEKRCNPSDVPFKNFTYASIHL